MLTRKKKGERQIMSKLDKNSPIGTNTRIYTVTELTRNIKLILENQLPELWIKGEISNLSTSSRGHTYLTIKDEFSQIHAVLFKSRRTAEDSPIPLKDGLSIFAFGKISVYEPRGSYQIIITKWEMAGIGALQLAFEKLKKKLYEEGLFDKKLKKQIPVLPQTVGVVTSPTGAAIKDIINVINRRFSNIHIILYPVRVQGKGSASEIANAIDEMNQFPDIDVLIIGRGGGSIEDLWSFNEECVARSIFRSKIPIISAVGHEIDYTISDLTADLRAPTPSAAAELVVGQKTEFTETIAILNKRLRTALISHIQELRARLNQTSSSYMLKDPKDAIRQYSQRLDEITHRLGLGIHYIHQIQTHRFDSIQSRMQNLDPKAVLKRGYSITTCMETGKIITDSDAIKNGDKLKTQVAKGKFISIAVKSGEQKGSKPTN